MSKLDELIKKLCPNGVEYKRIDELCAISRGKVMSKDYIRDNQGEYPVYSSQTENDGELGKISTYDFDGEYLTWTTDGANAGSVFYRNGKFSVTNVCGLLKVISNQITTKFLYYILSKETKKYVNSGMGNPKLMSNVMAKIHIPVPPIEVQNEIVRILDNFTELEVELEVELEARKKQYEYYNGMLWDKMKEYNEICISNLCRIGDGLHGTPKYFTGSGRYFINGNNLNNGKIVITDQTKEVNVKEFEKIEINNKTILLSINGTIGNIALYNGENIMLGKSVAFFEVFDKKLLNKYLYYYLQSKEARRYFDSMSTGSTIKNLGLKALRLLKIPIPPITVQKQIVSILDRFDKLCNDISEGIPTEIEARRKQYEYYRDKLLNFKEKINE